MTRWIIAGLCVMFLWAGQVHAEMVVIVNKSNPINSISKEMLSKYYKGLAQLWDSGKKVEPVDLVDTSPLAATFSQTILGMSMDKKRAMWIKAVLSGMGAPPKQMKDDPGVVSYVASEASAIGYVDKQSVTESVKVISVQ